MGVRILYDTLDDLACLYCSTSDVAFGPVVCTGNDGHGAHERIQSFLRWLDRPECAWHTYETVGLRMGRASDHDPRELSDAGLMAAYGDWMAQEAAQWAREEVPLCECCGEPAGEGSALCPACQEESKP